MADAGKIILCQGDTPATPDAGKIAVYSKTDDKLYYLDDTGVEHLVSTSGIVGCQTWLELSDTPSAYDDGMYVRSTTSGLEFATVSGAGGATTLLQLTDTPSAYDAGKYLMSTASGTEWATVSGGTGTSDHSLLTNLDYASAGHTGFQPAGDYITDTEMTTISGNIVAQIPTDFYTQAQVDSAIDTASGTLQSQITSNASGINTLDNQVDFLNVKIDTTSGTLQSEIDGLTLDHDALNNLDYASAGHTGFASTADNDLKFDKAGGTITGDTTIQGNLTVTGTQFIAHTEDLLVEDNLIVINHGETGGGVTKGWAGIEVDRGTETNYQFMFVEADDNFQVGISGSTQPVATREDSSNMDDGYVTYWDAANYRLTTSGSVGYSTIASTADLATVSGALNTAKADKSNVLELDNTDAFTPDADYEPATKKYVDDNLPDGLDLDPTPDTDETVSGLTATMTVGESVVFGDFLYMKSDGKLWKADADDDTAVPVMALAIATISADASGQVLLQGFARDDTWAWTVGGIVYASTTAGGATQTAPDGSGNMVQAIGVATHADRLWFNPNYAMGEIA